MKNVLLVLVAILLMSADAPGSFELAKEKASREHKLIVLRFTASDWCTPCRAMEKRVFNNDVFQHFSDDHLVLVEADFPKDKKLDDAIRRQNKKLAHRYQKERIYPYTVLLDADGKLLETWYGYAGQTADFYIGHINNYLPASNTHFQPADTLAQ